jgi:hypothetical protein
MRDQRLRATHLPVRIYDKPLVVMQFACHAEGACFARPSACPEPDGEQIRAIGANRVPRAPQFWRDGGRWVEIFVNGAYSGAGSPRDSDFYFGSNHAAGYVPVTPGGWYAVNPHACTYVTVSNALDRRHHEVVAYPGLPINFRAGLRF